MSLKPTGNLKKRAARRAWGIRAYVGGNGQGKSLAATWDLLPSLEAGRHVLSTERLLDYNNPRDCEDDACIWPEHPNHRQAHPLWVPFTAWQQFLDFRDGDVFIDEVAGVASSRESSSLPFQVARDMQQLRRRNVTLSWTAPAWARADKIMRECTQLVIECRGKFGTKAYDKEQQLAWPDRRLFRWNAFDAVEFEAWSAGTKDRAEKLNTDWCWRPGHVAESAYDTRAHVSSLSWASDTGRCLACGGRKTAPRCTCPDHAQAEATESRSAARSGHFHLPGNDPE